MSLEQGVMAFRTFGALVEAIGGDPYDRIAMSAHQVDARGGSGRLTHDLMFILESGGGALDSDMGPRRMHTRPIQGRTFRRDFQHNKRPSQLVSP